MTTAPTQPIPAVPDGLGASQRRRARARHIFLLTLLGALLMEAAWSLSVPPFVGLDEDQHAKRAAAVAHGDFNPRHRLAGSYGGVVEVPADLVLAAEPVCETRGVTDQFNCRPITDLRNGMVTVTSTASAYNPIFYAMVGLAGRPFNGTQSLYAMRACAEILCALMIALAAAITSRWASTRAPLVALQLAAAPVLWYSASILAPNGLEMCCALVMWAALLGIVRRQGDADRLTVVAGTVAACLLAAVRGLGPFWLVLIAMAVLVITPHETLRAVKAARWARTSALAIAACVAYAVAWTLAASATSVTPPVANPGSSIAAAFRGLPLWALGTFAMFPGRTETAPVAVYTIGVAVWILFLAIAIGRARTTIRISAAFIVLAAALIPFALTVVTYHRIGLFWQGRYALPFVVGFALMMGLALDEREEDLERWRIVAIVVGSLAINLVSLMAILHNYRPYRHLFQDWPLPSDALLATLVTASAAITVVVFHIAKASCWTTEAR